MTLVAPIIAGNWKLNHGPPETKRFFERFLPLLPAATGTVAFFPPAISFASAREALAGRSDVLLGVQNVHWETEGAFTGEISARMAADAGAAFALVGHSERRHLFGETDTDTALKTRAVLDAGMTVILCVGETLEEREAGLAFNVVERQIDAVSGILDSSDLQRLAIAYEPVWAIGTGRTASPADASEVHGHLRAVLDERWGDEARTIPILYGGSVKPDNSAELLAAPDVDGLLVGGASLDAESFAAICSGRA